MEIKVNNAIRSKKKSVLPLFFENRTKEVGFLIHLGPSFASSRRTNCLV
jgi:hypothetical protein